MNPHYCLTKLAVSSPLFVGSGGYTLRMQEVPGSENCDVGDRC